VSFHTLKSTNLTSNLQNLKKKKGQPNESTESIFECKEMPYRKETEMSLVTLLLNSDNTKKNDFMFYSKFEAYVFILILFHF
jgi:hypothetical protein